MNLAPNAYFILFTYFIRTYSAMPIAQSPRPEESLFDAPAHYTIHGACMLCNVYMLTRDSTISAAYHHHHHNGFHEGATRVKKKNFLLARYAKLGRGDLPATPAILGRRASWLPSPPPSPQTRSAKRRQPRVSRGRQSSLARCVACPFSRDSSVVCRLGATETGGETARFADDDHAHGVVGKTGRQLARKWLQPAAGRRSRPCTCTSPAHGHDRRQTTSPRAP